MSRREFNALVFKRLLPRFRDYYGYDTSGFRWETLNRISDHDAAWFLRALTTRTVIQDQAFFYAALSGAKEQIFWQGRKSASPRPITLWVEPVITIGAAGRLHSEFGWPRDLIGLQSKKNWAFDLVAYGDAQEPMIVCEVKKTAREVDNLIQAMIGYLSQPPLSEEPVAAKLRNAYRKVVGLRQMGPEYFWAIGPDKYGKLFRIVADMGMHVASLEEVDESLLEYRANDLGD